MIEAFCISLRFNYRYPVRGRKRMHPSKRLSFP
uniref:Uncharacterized protein n=1 Tax=Siphoviridae sp. ctFH16 TaxID=2827817 RepID=A0A8S5TN69_9CAUD|nr:MAG TPA: hypothetical protein [Siphoviridae sp. ctFH16]